MKTRFVMAFVAFACMAFAGDWNFDHLVKAVENHYGTKRLHIPLMGLANFALKVAHPAGTSGLKLAVFEDVSAGDGDLDELDGFMNRIDGLHPMVRVRNRLSGESTYIYTGEVGKSTRMLIAAFERRQATLIEVKVNMEALLKILGRPEGAGRMFGLKRERDCCSN